MKSRQFALLLSPVLFTATAAQAAELMKDDAGNSFAVEGYLQPGLRIVDNPSNCEEGSGDAEPVCTVKETPDGFYMPRARIAAVRTVGAQKFSIELEAIPVVTLLEAKAELKFEHGFDMTVGRFKVPFSSQDLVSDSKIALIDKGEIAGAGPKRQFGANLGWAAGEAGSLPAQWLRLDAGIYNGEATSTVNGLKLPNTDNLDSEFLTAARVTVAPLGFTKGLGEADLRPLADRAKLEAQLAFAVADEVRGEDNGDYKEQKVNADLTVRWHGATLYAESFTASKDPNADGAPTVGASGWQVQLSSMLPVGELAETLELAARFESWDPQVADKDADEEALTNAIASAGSGPANSAGIQGHTNLTLGANWYVRKHDLKLQASYTIRTATEDWKNSLADSRVDQDVDDNTAALQLTWRY